MHTKATYQILDSGTLKEYVNTVLTKAMGTLFHELETQWEKTREVSEDRVEPVTHGFCWF